MDVLVTGGHGVVGAQVLHQLVEAGHTITDFGRSVNDLPPLVRDIEADVNFFQGDITDPIDVYDAIATANPDRIIHLSAIRTAACQADPRAGFEVNVTGSINLLEAAATHGVERVVASSSLAVYGNRSPDEIETIDESVIRSPANVYGLTKFVMEEVGAVYQDRSGVEFAAVEPIRGLGPDATGSYSKDADILKAAVAGESLSVSAEPPMEMIYLEDFARAFVDALLADTLSYDRYILGSGEKATLFDIIEILRDEYPDADIEVTDQDEIATGIEEGLPVTDSTRLKGDLGWAPEHTFEEGIHKYLDWLRANPEMWSFDPDDE